MHETRGFFCKTANPWKLAKFAEPKKDTGPDLLAQQQGKKGVGARGVLTMGLAHSVGGGRSGAGLLTRPTMALEVGLGEGRWSQIMMQGREVLTMLARSTALNEASSSPARSTGSSGGAGLQGRGVWRRG